MFTHIALVDFWDIDPLPTPPTSDVTLMSFWRWHSAQVLAKRGAR
jgi:hypothetical protein